MRDRPSSSPTDLLISSTKMASTTSTNVNELLPGLESFLRSMVKSTNLDTDHRQIAAMYIDKIDQMTKIIDTSPKNQQGQANSIVDEHSLINTEIVSDDDSDDFTDEEEEQREQELIEQQLKQQQQQQQQQLQQQQQQQIQAKSILATKTPKLERRSSITDNQLYQATKCPSNSSGSQWYIDVPKNAYVEPSKQHSPQEHGEGLSSKAQSHLSVAMPPSSTVIADGLLLTYDESHNWIWRYYVLDDFDLICFPADKKSLSNSQLQSDNETSPLWVSDMTNAKVHTTVIDKVECLCLQIGVAEAIYVRPPDASQMNFWLKAFRDASSTKRSKENSKEEGRRNKKTLSRNARRMFAQFNRKKGQIVSHLLDHMANVTGVDEKTRKHCELRGFLVISFDNQSFVTKYCTIVDGVFRVHKSRLSEQTDHELCLNRCTLSFPEERTRDIQFALIDEQVGTIFIRGNNIYSMGRLLNTLAKYVEITGSSNFAFTTPVSQNSTPLIKHRQATTNSAETHLYSDVDLAAANPASSQSNEIYGASNIVRSGSTSNSSSVKTSIYHNAAKLHENDSLDTIYVLPKHRSSDDAPIPTNDNEQNPNHNNTEHKQEQSFPNPETYDRPKSYDNVAILSTPTDKNNNHLTVSTQKPEKQRSIEHAAQIEPSKSVQQSYSRSKSTSFYRIDDPPSSPENTIFCIRSSESTTSQNRQSRRRPNPIPRRASTHTNSTDYVNKITNIFSKNFQMSSQTSPPASPLLRPAVDHHINTLTYDTVPSSPKNLPTIRSTHNDFISKQPSATVTTKMSFRTCEQASSKRIYDIPITIERPPKPIVTPIEQYQKPIIRSSRSIEPVLPMQSKEHTHDFNNTNDDETPYAQGYDNLSKNDGIGKFRFVVPFNHSPTSAFVSSNASKKIINSSASSSSSTVSSYSTQRANAGLKSNSTLNTASSTGRSTLMTAV